MSADYELRMNGGSYDRFLDKGEEWLGEGSLGEPDGKGQVATSHIENSGLDSAPRTGAPHIVFHNVSKQYDSASGPVTALRHINLSIKQGEIFGIIGRSGAGKSSLIRTINRLEPINDGRIEIDNTDIRTLKSAGLINLRQRIGMIFQHFNLLRSKTVFENLAIPARAAGLSKEEIKKRADQLLELVGLEGKANVYPSRLSGGQKQRVGIARALILNPEILLCDEATSALDPVTTLSILNLLRDISQRLGLTIVLITHEMSVIRAVCDRVAVLDQGALIEEGPIWKVFGTPQQEVTQTLLAPLQVTLPFDLKKRLQTEPDNEHEILVLQLDVGKKFGGEAALDIHTLSSALGSEARLLSGNIERLQGHVQGRLLFGVSIQRNAYEKAVSPRKSILQQVTASLESLDVTAEVLGYV